VLHESVGPKLSFWQRALSELDPLGRARKGIFDEFVVSSSWLDVASDFATKRGGKEWSGGEAPVINRWMFGPVTITAKGSGNGGTEVTQKDFEDAVKEAGPYGIVVLSGGTLVLHDSFEFVTPVRLIGGMISLEGCSLVIGSDVFLTGTCITNGGPREDGSVRAVVEVAPGASLVAEGAVFCSRVGTKVVVMDDASVALLGCTLSSSPSPGIARLSDVGEGGGSSEAGVDTSAGLRQEHHKIQGGRSLAGVATMERSTLAMYGCTVKRCAIGACMCLKWCVSAGTYS
jgi:hypothetical protein